MVILLIDSSHEVRSRIQKMSKNSAFDLQCCGSLPEAAAFLEQKAADLILLDINLGGVKNLETFDAVVSRFPNLPVVVISSETNQSPAIQAIQKGAHGFLVYDRINRETLLRTIRNAITRHTIGVQLHRSASQGGVLPEPDGDWEYWLDTNGYLVYISPSCEPITGYAPQEILADPSLLFGILMTKDPPSAPAPSEGGKLASLQDSLNDIRIRNRSGVILCFSRCSKPIFDEKGKNLGWRVTNRDITKRVQAEEEIRRKDAILEAINRIAARLLRTTDWQDEIPNALAVLGQAAGVSCASLYTVMAGKDGSLTAMPIHEWTVEGTPSPADHSPILLSSGRYERWGRLFSNRQVLAATLSSLPDEERLWLEKEGTGSLLIAPVFTNGRFWGLVGLDDCRPERSWTQDEIELLQTAAGLLGATIQRQIINETLQSNITKLDQLLQNFPGIVQRFDGDFRCIYANPAVKEAFGVLPEEFADKINRDFGFPDDLAALWKEWLKSVFETGQSLQVEYHAPTCRGLAYWEARFTPEYGPDGAIVSVLVISLDVTARRHAEMAFRTLVENSLQELYIIQEETIVYANPIAIQGSGFSARELTGMPIRNLLEYIQPQDQPAFQKLLDESAGISSPVRRVLQVCSPGGRLRWMDILISCIEYQGRPAFQVAQVDITEQKLVEERLHHTLGDLQQITASISAALWMGEQTVEGEIYTLYVSPVIEKLTGRPVDYFLEDPLHNWTKVIHPEDRGVEKAMVEAARRGEATYEFEYRIFCPDGEMRWVRDSVHVDRLPENRILLSGVVMDITDTKTAAIALQEANEQLQHSVQELAARNRDAILLNEMGDVLQSCMNLEEIYEVLGVFGERFLPGHSGAFYVIHPEQKHAEAVAIWGKHISSLSAFTTDTCWAMRRGRVHIYIPGQVGLPCNHIQEDPPISTICVPLAAQGGTLGLLYTQCEHSGPFDHCQQLTITVAERAALAISNMRLQETLRMQSIRDPLTGLFNRRYMDESLKRELARAGRREYSFAVVMADIDHFKLFNDQHGHQAGDVILQALSAYLAGSVRGEDVVCRYGGEEFVIILPEMVADNASKRINEICKGVRQLTVEYRDQHLGGLTVSIGVACYPQHGKDASSLLQSADQALYIAKKAGRDRVVLAAKVGE